MEKLTKLMAVVLAAFTTVEEDFTNALQTISQGDEFDAVTLKTTFANTVEDIKTQTNEAVQAAQAHAADLQTQLDEAQATIAERDQAISELNEQITEANEQVTTVTSERDEARQELEETQTSLTEAQGEIVTLQEANEKLSKLTGRKKPKEITTTNDDGDLDRPMTPREAYERRRNANMSPSDEEEEVGEE